MITVVCPYGRKRRDPAGVIAGAGGYHAGAKYREIPEQTAPQSAGWFQTSTPPSQQAPSSGYYRCA
jgi:hypothetical protein